MKQCKKCLSYKDISNFYKCKTTKDKVQGSCKECYTEQCRLNRLNNAERYKEKKAEYYKKNRETIINRSKKHYFENIDSKKAYYGDYYKNNINRILSTKYKDMKRRVNGKTKQVSRSLNKYICSKEAFINWCYEKNNMKKFMVLYKDWGINNYSKKFAPSIDRIDSSKGYHINNIQWLTHSQNSRKG